jgi:hypothetical protein
MIISKLRMIRGGLDAVACSRWNRGAGYCYVPLMATLFALAEAVASPVTWAFSGDIKILKRFVFRVKCSGARCRNN